MFCENTSQLSSVEHFPKKLHLRRSTDIYHKKLSLIIKISQLPAKPINQIHGNDELEQKQHKVNKCRIINTKPSTCLNIFVKTYFESNSFVWLRSKQQILPCFIWGFNALFVSRHKSVLWFAFCYFRVVNL